MDGLVEILQGLRPPGREIWLAIGTAGDRTDDILQGFAVRAALGSDHLAIAELKKYLRGRPREDVIAQLRHGAARAGKHDVPVYLDELRALRGMLEASSPGDVVGITALAQRAQAFRWLRTRDAKLLGPSGRPSPRSGIGRRSGAPPEVVLRGDHRRAWEDGGAWSPPRTRRWNPRSSWPPTAGPFASSVARTASSSPIEGPGASSPCSAASSSGTTPRGSPPPSPRATGRWRRGVASSEGAAQRVRYVDIPEERYDGYYNGIANGILWFAHHYLWDIARTPTFDERTEHDWADYVEANRAFARALAVEAKHDPDLPDPGLPPHARAADAAGDGPGGAHPPLLAHAVRRADLPPDAPGRHAAVDPARACSAPTSSGSRAVSGARTSSCPPASSRTSTSTSARIAPRWTAAQVQIRSFPVAVGAQEIQEAAATDRAKRLRTQVEKIRGGRKLLLRVDRLEPSKNILRGFLAFELLLQKHPEWRGDVVFLALLSPSREEVPGLPRLRRRLPRRRPTGSTPRTGRRTGRRSC